jgi:hypothetical protein
MQRLGASEANLNEYQELLQDHLRLSADIVAENRFGQRSDDLPWFWYQSGNQLEGQKGWMEECQCPILIQFLGLTVSHSLQSQLAESKRKVYLLGRRSQHSSE